MDNQPKYPYVEHGKYFSPHEGRASDFETLDYSNENLVGKLGYFRNALLAFPTTTLFSENTGNVSFALLIFADRYEGQQLRYLFVQIQRRQESELSENPRMFRPFNQIRFTYLTPDDIQEEFSSGSELYKGLAFDLKKDDPSQKPLRLKNYFAPGELHPLPGAKIEFPSIHYETLQLPLVKIITNALVNSELSTTNSPQPLCFIIREGDLLSGRELSLPAEEREAQSIIKRIEILQAVQYLVFPYLGVITFALDHVTEQDVHVRLFTRLDPEVNRMLPPERIFDTTSHLSSGFNVDYYSVAFQLVQDKKGGVNSDWLYSKKLINLLKVQRPPYDAVVFLRVKTQKTDAERARFLQKNLRLLAENTELLYEEFGLLSEACQKKLIQDPKTDLALLYSLLDYHLPPARRQLLAFYASFLKVPFEKRDKTVKAILCKAIRISTINDLESVPLKDRGELYRALLLVRGEEFGAELQPGVSSANVQEAGPSLTVLDALLSLPVSQELSDAIRFFLEKEPGLFDEILNSLDFISDTNKFLWLLSILPNITLDDYGKLLLSHLCLEQHYESLSRSPEVFRKLLQFGRELLYQLQVAENNLSELTYPGTSKDEIPLLTLGSDDLVALRQASLVVAAQNPRFAEWYLLAELAYLDDEQIFREDFENLINTIDRTASEFKATSPEFQYLISQDQPTKGRSLANACRLYDAGQTRGNEDFFWRLVDYWLSANIPLPSSDIVYMISLLPETMASSEQALFSIEEQANEHLSRIVESDIQTENIQGIPANEAVKWLRRTRGTLRTPYLRGEEDLLYLHLLEHKRPGKELAWELLVNEPSNFTLQSTGDWQQHLEIGQGLLQKLPQIDSEVRRYLELATDLYPDPTAIPEKDADKREALENIFPYRREILTTLVTRSYKRDSKRTLQAVDWVGLLVFRKYERTKKVRELCELVLKHYLMSESEAGLAQLEDYVLKRLYEFAQDRIEDAEVSLRLRNARALSKEQPAPGVKENQPNQSHLVKKTSHADLEKMTLPQVRGEQVAEEPHGGIAITRPQGTAQVGYPDHWDVDQSTTWETNEGKARFEYPKSDYRPFADREFWIILAVVFALFLITLPFIVLAISWVKDNLKWLVP